MTRLFILLLLLVLMCTALAAQKRTFLRVYSIAGHKIGKGHFAGTTDSSLLIYKNTVTAEISARSIGFIKTRRSLGHNILLSAIIGAIPASILGAASGEPKTNDNTFGGILHDATTFTSGEAALAGFIVGGVAGTAAGAIITVSAKRSTFAINGSIIEEWRLQRKRIDLLPSGK